MGCSSSKIELVSGPNTASTEAATTQEVTAVERAAQAQPETLLSSPTASKLQQATVEEAAPTASTVSPEAAKTQEAAAVERAALVQPETLLSAPAVSNAQEATAEETAAHETSSKSVKVRVLRARGLRRGDVVGNSEVFVEASVFPAKAGSMVTTQVFESYKDYAATRAIRANFDVELEVKGYALGDAVMFLVKDKDRHKDDVLGRGVLSEEQLRTGFQGEVALTDTGHGHEAFLRVKVEAQEEAADPVIEEAGIFSWW